MTLFKFIDGFSTLPRTFKKLGDMYIADCVKEVKYQDSDHCTVIKEKVED